MRLIIKSLSKRTKIEFLIIILSIILIVLFSWIQLKFFGVNSYLFLVVFNINLILLLLILFLVIRNSVKLFIDRKRGVGGSRLRTKLVLSFISLSLIPTILMFLIAIKFVQTSVDYWFRNQIDTSLKTALDIGKINYNYIQDDLKQKLIKISKLNNKDLNKENIKKQFGLDILIIHNKNKKNLILIDNFEDFWENVKPKIKWEEVKEKDFWVNIYSYGKSDFVLGILHPEKNKDYYIIGGLKLKYNITTKMEKIVQGIYEYNQLKSLKSPLKISLYILLGVMTLLIIFGSMWFGLKLANEISSPILALSSGTKRIALGDLNVKIDDESQDELGALVKSFNIMAEKLKQSQMKIKQANKRLSEQNLELEHQKKYMETLLNTITSGVISLDNEIKITTINQSAQKILQLKEQEALGKKIIDILPKDHKYQFMTLIKKLQNRPHEIVKSQLNITIQNQEKKLLVNTVSLKDPKTQPTGIIIIFEDITELDKIQRMAAWQEVARRIAHEIKNPLTPIKLSAQRLEKKFSQYIEDKTFRDSIGVIIRQVDHLKKMVEEFSEFAKMPEIVLKEQDLHPLLDELMVLYKSSYPDIKWHHHIDNNIPKFKFDANAIKRVLINILNNAIEATQNVTNPVIKFLCNYNEKTKEVEIEIIDNGPGLKEKELSRIFEPYFSMKKGSTGLGLTIAKSIVNEHGGEIYVTSSPWKGTTFKIIIPLVH